MICLFDGCGLWPLLLVTVILMAIHIYIQTSENAMLFVTHKLDDWPQIFTMTCWILIRIDAAWRAAFEWKTFLFNWILKAWKWVLCSDKIQKDKIQRLPQTFTMIKKRKQKLFPRLEISHRIQSCFSVAKLHFKLLNPNSECSFQH